MAHPRRPHSGSRIYFFSCLESSSTWTGSARKTWLLDQSWSGAFGQGFLSWLIHLINTGYRKVLALPDLYPLPHETQSENVGARFDLHWARSESYPLQCRRLCTTIMLIQLLAPQRTTKDLVSSLFWSLWWHFLAPVRTSLAFHLKFWLGYNIHHLLHLSERLFFFKCVDYYTVRICGLRFTIKTKQAIE